MPRGSPDFTKLIRIRRPKLAALDYTDTGSMGMGDMATIVPKQTGSGYLAFLQLTTKWVAGEAYYCTPDTQTLIITVDGNTFEINFAELLETLNDDIFPHAPIAVQYWHQDESILVITINKPIHFLTELEVKLKFEPSFEYANIRAYALYAVELWTTP